MRGERLEEARGEAAEASVPETGIRLELGELEERGAERRERVLGDAREVEVDQVRHEEAADQELHREIGDPFAARCPEAHLALVDAIDGQVADHVRETR